MAIVFCGALLTALATGLGVLPLARKKKSGNYDYKRACGEALASGMMLAASIVLLYEAYKSSKGALTLIIGFVLGWAFVWLSVRLLHDREDDLSVGNLQGKDARRALLIVGAMTMHSFAEGVGLGVSWADGTGLGIFLTLVIALHNIPEGLAIGLVLIPRGVSTWRASGWAIFSSLPQPLIAVPAYLAVGAFAPLLPGGLAFAGAAMIALVVHEMLPEVRSELDNKISIKWISIGIMGIFILQLITMMLIGK